MVRLLLIRLIGCVKLYATGPRNISLLYSCSLSWFHIVVNIHCMSIFTSCFSFHFLLPFPIDGEEVMKLCHKSVLFMVSGTLLFHLTLKMTIWRLNKDQDYAQVQKVSKSPFKPRFNVNLRWHFVNCLSETQVIPLHSSQHSCCSRSKSESSLAVIWKTR